MKSIMKNSLWLFLVAALIGMPASAFAVTFLIGSEDIRVGAVQTDHIAPYAITNDKIAAGTITQDKLAFTPGGSHYANVVIVAKSGGDFTDPIAAVNSITDASAAKPYLVKVMPGVYDLGTSTLQMKAYVTLEGNGAENTIINATSAETESCNQGTVNGTINMADNSAVKNLTVNVTGGPGNRVMVFNVWNVKASIDGVKMIAMAGIGSDGVCVGGNAGNLELSNSIVESTTTGEGQANAVYADSGSSKATIVRSRLFANSIVGSWGDVVNYEQTNATAVISDSIVEGVGPVNNILNGCSGNITVTNSKILGSCNLCVGLSMKIANSLIEGGNGSACRIEPNTPKFINNYDENFDPIPNQ